VLHRIRRRSRWKILRRTLHATTLGLGLIGSAAAIVAAFFRNDLRLAGIKPFDSTYTTVVGVAAVFLLAVIGLVRAARRSSEPSGRIGRVVLLAALAGIAAFLQINDRPGRPCWAPEAAIQAHAVWHVLMAAASRHAYDLFRVLGGRPWLADRKPS
jgi:FtsH-binding integral membrane protein